MGRNNTKMCVMPAHFHFIALILWNIQNKTENQKMKKCFSTLLVLAMAMTLWSCSDDEGGKIPENVTRSIKVINHIVDTKADAVMPLNESVIDYKLNRTNMTIDLTIRAKWDGEHESTVTLSGIQTTEHNGVCSFKASGSGIENLKGHIDFNEATMRINYTAEGKYRVICTTPEIYSTQCATSVLYTDGQSWQSNATMYQFNINVAEGTAAINVMDLMDQAKRRTLTTVKSKTPAKVTVTKEGYIIQAESVPTTTTYMLNGKATTTTQYPIADLEAKFDMENDVFEAQLLVGDLSLTASGAVSN